jgi:hypothetical protein
MPIETPVLYTGDMSALPLVGWAAVLLIMVGTGVTVYRMLRDGSLPPPRSKRRANGSNRQNR